MVASCRRSCCVALGLLPKHVTIALAGLCVDDGLQLIRMEYSASGEFEDRATLAVLNRNLPVPLFSVLPTPYFAHSKFKVFTTGGGHQP